MLDLASAASGDDSVSPLSEHVLLHLRYGGDPQARDLLLRQPAANWPGTPTWTRPTRPRGRAANWSSTPRTGATAWAWR